MGGVGSGRWNGYTPMTRVDECVVLAATALAQGRWHDLEGRVTWPDERPPANILDWAIVQAGPHDVAMRIAFPIGREIVRETVPLEMRLSGPGRTLRWFFRCPACNRRVLKLYRPWGWSPAQGGPAFQCRKCYGLAYPRRGPGLEAVMARLARMRWQPLDGFEPRPVHE